MLSMILLGVILGCWSLNQSILPTKEVTMPRNPYSNESTIPPHYNRSDPFGLERERETKRHRLECPAHCSWYAEVHGSIEDATAQLARHLAQYPGHSLEDYPKPIVTPWEGGEPTLPCTNLLTYVAVDNKIYGECTKCHYYVQISRDTSGPVFFHAFTEAQMLHNKSTTS